jgi:hypothetical protein
MAVVFLWVNAALYAAFAAWCAVLPDKTSSAIGFGFLNPGAKSEFITVYGGLELGMALFFMFAALNPSMHTVGLLFALCLYACLAVFRAYTLLTIDGIGTFPYTMFAIEVPMALLSGWLYFKAAR